MNSGNEFNHKLIETSVASANKIDLGHEVVLLRKPIMTITMDDPYSMSLHEPHTIDFGTPGTLFAETYVILTSIGARMIRFAHQAPGRSSNISAWDLLRLVGSSGGVDVHETTIFNQPVGSRGNVHEFLRFAFFPHGGLADREDGVIHIDPFDERYVGAVIDANM